MKVINCGMVIYLITAHHIATIVYKRDEENNPIAWIYYDGKCGEGVQAENGQTLRHAFQLAKWTVKRDEYADQHYDKWLAILLKQTGIIYRHR